MNRFLWTSIWLLFFALPMARGQGLGVFNDPRAEAEYLALEVSAQLRPPVELANAIEADLVAIRSTFPQYADIHVLPDWLPGQLLIGMTPAAYGQFKDGTFTGFLPLYAELGTPQVAAHDFGQWIQLQFAQMYHGVRLAEQFDVVSGVRYAEPNGIIGDGNDIEARSDRTYTFWRKSGDCPSGCIYRQSWDFYVNDNGAFLGTPPNPTSILRGDFNGDGTVDAADYTAWRDGLGIKYDEGDYADFKGNFGMSSSAAAGSTANVPEPGDFVLVHLGLLLAGFRRRGDDWLIRLRKQVSP